MMLAISLRCWMSLRISSGMKKADDSWVRGCMLITLDAGPGYTWPVWMDSFWLISYSVEWYIVFGTWMRVIYMWLTVVVRGHCTVLDAIASWAVCLAGRMAGGVEIGGSSDIFLKLRLCTCLHWSWGSDRTYLVNASGYGCWRWRWLRRLLRWITAAVRRFSSH